VLGEEGANVRAQEREGFRRLGLGERA
jgi:hypothetical protein